MCLTTKLLPRKHTARRDMVVYKHGDIINTPRINHYEFKSLHLIFCIHQILYIKQNLIFGDVDTDMIFMMDFMLI